MAIWDVGRFVGTLIDFEVLPLSDLIKPLLGQTVGNQQDFGGQPRMGTILVIGDRPPLGDLVTALQAKGYRVQQTNLAAALQSLDHAVMMIVGTEITPDQMGQLLTQAGRSPAWQDPSWDLFNFRESTPALAQLWGAVDDVVMGGVSASRLQFGSDGAYFAGIVSTENNGGFASVRTKTLLQPWDLSSYHGFRLRVKGDGQRYKFIARCEGRWDGVGYSYSFDTQADTWITVDIPFKDLIPVFRAKSVPQMGNFDPSRVYAMQLMLSKFEYDGQLNPRFTVGSFTLGLAAIAVYGGQPFPQVIALSETTAPLETLQESALPYCLLHCPQGLNTALIPQVLDAIGDRQKINQTILCE